MKLIPIYCIDAQGYFTFESQAPEFFHQPGTFNIPHRAVTVPPPARAGYRYMWVSNHPDYDARFHDDGEWLEEPLQVTVYQVDADGLLVGSRTFAILEVGADYSRLPANVVLVPPPKLESAAPMDVVAQWKSGNTTQPQFAQNGTWHFVQKVVAQ